MVPETHGTMECWTLSPTACTCTHNHSCHPRHTLTPAATLAFRCHTQLCGQSYKSTWLPLITHLCIASLGLVFVFRAQLHGCQLRVGSALPVPISGVGTRKHIQHWDDGPWPHLCLLTWCPRRHHIEGCWWRAPLCGHGAYGRHRRLGWGLWSQDLLSG